MSKKENISLSGKRAGSESFQRSILKTLTWRIAATFITFAVAYVLTRKIALSVGISFSDMAIKLISYYGHERIWNRIDFGRKKEIKPDYQI